MWLPLHRPRALFLLFLPLREPSQECYTTAGPQSLKLPQPLGLGCPWSGLRWARSVGCHDNMTSSLAQVLECSAPSPWLRARSQIAWVQNLL